MAGHKIDEMQRRADVSEAELARRLKTSQTQLQRLKVGDRRLTLDWLRRIARALDCSVADLLSDADAPNRVSVEEQSLLAELAKRGKSDMSDMLEIVAAIDRLITREAEQRRVKDLLGHSKPTTALAGLWTGLADSDRSRLLEIVRLALPEKTASVRAA